MKLPEQAAAVVPQLSARLPRLSGGGGTTGGIEPAAVHTVNCESPTPEACVCDNGIVTCCGANVGCHLDASGFCDCDSH